MPWNYLQNPTYTSHTIPYHVWLYQSLSPTMGPTKWIWQISRQMFLFGWTRFFEIRKKNNLLGIIMGGKGSHQVSGKFILFIPSMWSGRLMEMFSHTGHVPPNCQVMDFFFASVHLSTVATNIRTIFQEFNGDWMASHPSSFERKNTPPHRLDQ